jgi:hypothetical protein
MDVGVRSIFNFQATGTFIATISRRAGSFDRILAIERFGQSAREQFQFVQLIAGEQIGMAEAIARERALEQLNALRWPGEIFEGAHFRLIPSGILMYVVSGQFICDE